MGCKRKAIAIGHSTGKTKILFNPTTHKLLGVSIIGPHAGDIISEGALAIEMGADAEDISLTIHPHPTLSETFANAAEVFSGTVTDLYVPKKRSDKAYQVKTIFWDRSNWCFIYNCDLVYCTLILEIVLNIPQMTNAPNISN